MSMTFEILQKIRDRQDTQIELLNNIGKVLVLIHEEMKELNKKEESND